MSGPGSGPVGCSRRRDFGMAHRPRDTGIAGSGLIAPMVGVRDQVRWGAGHRRCRPGWATDAQPQRPRRHCLPPGRRHPRPGRRRAGGVELDGKLVALDERGCPDFERRVQGCTSLPRRRRRPPGHQVESPQPDPVGSVHHSPRARVQTFPLHAVGIPELRVVEDVAASTGTSTAMRPIGSDPLCAATRHPGPHNLLIRSFGQGSSTGRPAAMSVAS
jgi:hypothetical protein